MWCLCVDFVITTRYKRYMNAYTTCWCRIMWSRRCGTYHKFYSKRSLASIVNNFCLKLFSERATHSAFSSCAIATGFSISSFCCWLRPLNLHFKFILWYFWLSYIKFFFRDSWWIFIYVGKNFSFLSLCMCVCVCGCDGNCQYLIKFILLSCYLLKIYWKIFD